MYQFASEPLLPWSDTDNDKRFNKIAQKIFIVFFILFFVIPFLPTPEVKKDKFEEIPPRFARLLIKQPIKPIVKKPVIKKPEKKKEKEKKKKVKKPKKKPAKKKKTKPKPKPKPKPSAEKVAQSAFEAGFGDTLSDIRDNFDVAALKNAPLTKAKKRKNAFNPNVLTSKNASSGSDGIKKRNVALGGKNKLKQHKTADVASNIPTTGNTSRSRSRSARWSDEEVQLVVQKNKGALYSIYNKALRKDPGLQGTILLKITINSSGKVIKVVIISSELKNKALDKRIRLRFKRFKFGSKPGAANFTFTYPLVLIPQ